MNEPAMSYAMGYAREEMLRNLHRRHPSPVGRQTDYELVSDRKSYYESAPSPDMMPELSPARFCYRCGHGWPSHGEDGCGGTAYEWVAVDERRPMRCGCALNPWKETSL